MRFDDFITENQALVITYNVDRLLEDCGFDFRLGNGGLNNREYFKLIVYRGETIEVVFNSDEEIYIRKDKSRRVNIVPFVEEVIEGFTIPKFIKNEYFTDVFVDILDKYIEGEIKYKDPLADIL